jgi:L-lysine 2,3-aminomutase
MAEHKVLEKSISSVEELANYLDLSSNEKEQLEQVVQIHPMRVSPYYLSLINWNRVDLSYKQVRNLLQALLQKTPCWTANRRDCEAF